ncbi:argininosuccinate lyase [Cysteiniphilum halobium]|uniref:argininosuccinate lyase n=1 Tax=Cysteiniphilum halobium TaxID=2219059 RepID=UPI000E6463FB|nr:argininosuccinate lyase [Cysteiniphilum halobium]
MAEVISKETQEKHKKQDLQGNQKKQKLWGGRFTEDNNPLFVRFNASLSFDYRLLPYDIKATKAFTDALCDINVLSKKELNDLHQALTQIKQDVDDNPHLMQQAIENGVEDIHTFVEQSLVERVGDLAYKANTGRSRNEQVSCATRLWVLDHIAHLCDLIQDLQVAFVTQAKANVDVFVMGYTHLQQAQPITWGHYFLSFYEMLKRDDARLLDIKKRVNASPLGMGAIAGNAWHLDRQKMADALGFGEIAQNSLDAVSDRDYIIELLAAISLIGTHLSRFAEDMITYSTTEFDLVEMSDLVTTGSSLMPQKKNPDAMELVRGKAGRLNGYLVALLTTVKALPSGYNKDLQEDKEALFAAVDTVSDLLKVTTITVESLVVNKDKSYQGSFCVATELADYLTKKGIAFRKAHHIVGEITAYALSENKSLTDLTLSEFQRFSVMIDNDVYQVLSIEAAVNSKTAMGGTAVANVAKAISVIEKVVQL